MKTVSKLWHYVGHTRRRQHLFSVSFSAEPAQIDQPKDNGEKTFIPLIFNYIRTHLVIFSDNDISINELSHQSKSELVDDKPSSDEEVGQHRIYYEI